MQSSLMLNSLHGQYREVSPSNLVPGSPDTVPSLRSPTSQRVASPLTRKRRSSTSTLSRRGSSLSPLIREAHLRHSVARHHLPSRQQASPPSPPIRDREPPGKMSFHPMPDQRDLVDQRGMQSPYTLPASYIPTMMDTRPHSSNSNMGVTSSLSGAVGEFDIPPQLRNPSTVPKRMRSSFSAHSPVPWNGQNDMIAPPSPFLLDRVPSAHQRQSSTAQPDMAFTHPLIHGTASVSPPYLNSSGASSSTSPYPTPFSNQIAFQSDRSSPRDLEEEIRALRKKVKELELVNEHSRLHIKELERELARGSTAASSLCRSGDAMAAPPPLQDTPSPSSIHHSWKARTDARTRLFCSLNRAGNALCSWHDSRRERRSYPPRMAPAGYLNCGCTYEEALFEESLSRHGVGSYHPGETVRMDPALRNPLLRLLQKRYNYRDGEFERDTTTGEWLEGEGHMAWEQKLAAGTLSVRKARGEDRR